jgi:hypothetical protein
VQAAFQYTFRDDPAYPVGLADATLSRLWPAYELWKAWGGERVPAGPAPTLPDACVAAPPPPSPGGAPAPAAASAATPAA